MPLHPLQVEWDANLRGDDPLDFPGYTPPQEESVRTGVCAIATAGNSSVRYAMIESRLNVRGGSMGAAAGEKVVRAYDRAVDERLPIVVVASSGGARLQEGMLALIQLPRTAAAAARHARAGLLSVGLFRTAVTGGVLASYAALTDVRAAEPGTVIGFAGPRVVELTTGEPLPRESHTAESARRHALVDAVVAPHDAHEWVEAALGVRPAPLAARYVVSPEADVVDGAWGEVQRARAPGRPSGIDWAAMLCSAWTELAGTDPVVRAGLATIAGRRVVMVATDRYARDGRPGPDGFRLARRAIALADRTGLPLVTLVDTPGADPRAASEAGGIAHQIAETFAAMAELRSASVSVCVGEGGSGGALALAFADRLLMLQHAVFSVIGPEGAAAILDRDLTKTASRAEDLRLTAADAVALGIADGLLRETTEAVVAAIVAGVSGSAPGDRLRRFDRASGAWVR